MPDTKRAQRNIVENYQCLLVGDKSTELEFHSSQMLMKSFIIIIELYVWRAFSETSTVRKILTRKKEMGVLLNLRKKKSLFSKRLQPLSLWHRKA